MDVLKWADCDRARGARAVEANIWSLWKNFGLGPDSAFHHIHGALALETPIRSHPYNFVMHFEGGDDPSAQIDRLFRHFEERQTPFVWLITSGSSPADLGRRLEERGMHLSEVMPEMVARLDRIPPPPAADPAIQITEATPGDAADIFNFVSYRWNVPDQYRTQAHAMYRMFGVGETGSPIRAWLARKDGVLVGKSILHLGAGVAGIHGVMVRPEARGAGLGRTLTLLALDAARASGHEVAVLGSSPMAESLYASMGFEKVGDLPLYATEGGFHV